MRKPAQAKSPSKSKPGFPGYAVGIGASAGGLEALETFFQNCPLDSDAAFFVIQHLSPDHKSMMSDLLARRTKMPVVVVEEDMPIAANTVYLIPPAAIMRVVTGSLHLTPKSPHGLTLPIDIFFSSLAEAFKNRAVGIILSGTGSDGTRGAVEINAGGGFLMAQDPLQAKFDGMPRSVIATGVVDAVMPGEHLPARLLTHIRNLPYQAQGEPAKPTATALMTRDEAFDGVLRLLNEVSGIDFQHYKPATVLRRIERRMQVRHIPRLSNYLELLETERDEQFSLRRELLISVTSFFRDPDAFDLVASQAIADIVGNAKASDSIRVWTAGTSTGEEAYSLAMLFLEAFERERRWPSLKIFATDVSQQNIEIAGIGQYPESAAAELTPERLERFFTRLGNSCAVKPELRQCIVFARHNLLTDPPFTRMDLVSCRNALIYFRPDAQSRALRRLQYAIRPDGYLFLGPSESLAGVSAGFVTLNSKFKLFKRVGPSPPLLFDSSRSQGEEFALGANRPVRDKVAKARLADAQIVDLGLSGLLDAYVPPAILVNDRHEAIHLFGNVQPYFRVRQGSASLELSRILPEPLVPVAFALTYKAAKDGTVQISDRVEVPQADEAPRLIRLVARPLKLKSDERFLLLCFEEQSDAAPRRSATTIDIDAETMARIDILERELAATRENLQATIEELETTNEELQATNEELMASNEELQSSNEELQSVNEELNTVNAEYQEKMSLLGRANADLDSLSKAVGVASVFVDHDLTLTRFSPDAMEIFKLRETDVGRPLGDITHSLVYPGFATDLRLTMQDGQMIEHQVAALDGRLFLIRILPYAVPSTQDKGAVATFVDVTALRDAGRLQSIIDALPEHVAVLQEDGSISMVNGSWRRFAAANGNASMQHCGPGSNYFTACRSLPDEKDSIAKRAADGVKSVLDGRAPSFSLQYPCHSPTEQRWFVMTVSPVTGQDYAAVVSHFDITAWYPQEARQRRGKIDA